MMHPIDIAPRNDAERNPTGGSAWWAVIALVVIVGLVIALTVALSGGEQTTNQPPANEAPLAPGSNGASSS
jgi:hypothetical protein